MDEIRIPLLKIISLVGTLGFLVLSGTIGLTEFGTCGAIVNTKTGNMHFEMARDLKPWVSYYLIVWFLISALLMISTRIFKKTK